MGSEEVLGSSAVIMDPTISPCNGSMVQLMDDGEEGENLGVDLLNDLDLYLEDIKDRLTISRMVSDSVIKDDGSVCLGMRQEQNNRKNELYSDTFVEHDRLQESLGNLKIDVKGQLKKLKKEIHKQEREFQAEIEWLVIQNYIRGLQEELEQRLCDQNTQYYSNGSASWLEKVKELSSLRQELDAIAKSLSVPESGQLISHGSLEHWKSSGHHVFKWKS
ncbi:hypothetical protein OIU77_015636 [Salix suchowensis]|uniref:Uncharacterized protein n=1 Tax=Salix suchowensis TaxID=1278906 RepID=A0ABQ8ZHM4_9ROSI|nr:hypothetical protein OIU77_015636 [Salix suchowensis]